jgi:NAD(P) transhydrogenase subunit alpha
MGTTTAAPSRLTIGVLTETRPGERRVALDPGSVRKLVDAGRAVVVQAGAGLAASFPDALYHAAGATVTSRDDVSPRADVIAVVRSPDEALVARLHAGQLLVGLVDPLNNLATMQALAARAVTVAAFELLPRTLSRAQAMDALSSQASAAGYRAAIVAAEAFGRYLSMMITASGTATPAKTIVIGTGVAGLQAIATARRLGAVVTGYDVRAASRREVESLGATFLTSSISPQVSAGGYASPLSPAEAGAQQAELAAALTAFDIIITTAKVPGRTPPVLVTTATLDLLRPGSVCVDLGSSDRGGNVAGSVEGEHIVTPGGVVVVGAGELASDLPTSASQMYGRNVASVIASLAPDAVVVVDPDDEIHRAIVVTHGGIVTSETVRSALDRAATPPTTASPTETATERVTARAT